MSGRPLDQLKLQTDPEGCHITGFPSRIWVFGGPCESDGAPRSLRDSFWRQTLTRPKPDWLKHLDRPEDHPGWLEHSGYSDLLEFERDACYLAKAVIIFAESPGAYAELGAVALDEAILPRLTTVVQHRYTQGESESSFLALGPLRRVRERGLLCVVGDGENSLDYNDFQDVIDSVDEWLPANHKREKLQHANPAHILLLIADLVDLLLISSEPDLIEALNHFGLRMATDQLKKRLNLLKFLKFVELHQAGSTPYWVRHGSEDGPWVDYTALSSQPKFDRSRFKMKAKDLIEANPRLKPVYERGRK